MASKVLLKHKSKFQEITLLENDSEIALYLDNDIQFFSKDEYRYHEALVHPVMNNHTNPSNVLILGGGDGLAAREVLKYPTVNNITIVDIDPDVTNICSITAKIRELNKDSLLSDKVEVINIDAREFLDTTDKKFDIIIVDFPDPINKTIGNLYSKSMFTKISNVLESDGCGCIQSGDIYRMPNSFWCIVQTAVDASLYMLPYHTNVPSFGEWGFNLFGKRLVKVPFTYNRNIAIKSFDDKSSAAMAVMPLDMYARSVIVNTEDNNMLNTYYNIENEEYMGFPSEIK